MNSHEHKSHQPPKYGAWDEKRQRFAFGIEANTPQLAQQVLREMNRMARDYEIKEIPEKHINPPRSTKRH